MSRRTAKSRTKHEPQDHSAIRKSRSPRYVTSRASADAMRAIQISRGVSATSNTRTQRTTWLPRSSTLPRAATLRACRGITGAGAAGGEAQRRATSPARGAPRPRDRGGARRPGRARRAAPRCPGEDAGDRPAARQRRRRTDDNERRGAARADTNHGPIFPELWTTVGQSGALSRGSIPSIFI